MIGAVLEYLGVPHVRKPLQPEEDLLGLPHSDLGLGWRDGVKAFCELHPSLDLNALRMVIYAGVLIGLMILRPEGLFGEREPFGRKKAPRAAPPPAPNDKADADDSSAAPREKVAVE